MQNQVTCIEYQHTVFVLYNDLLNQHCQFVSKLSRSATYTFDVVHQQAINTEMHVLK